VAAARPAFARPAPPGAPQPDNQAADTPAALVPGDWSAVRSQFALDPNQIHMGGFYLASHPTSVRQAIDRYRTALDLNPITYHHEHVLEHEQAVHAAAGEYLGVN